MTRGLDEKFCLRWNDFENNISTAFKDLKEEKDFFDVTLACEDNQLQAHKVILSACSPFFRSVLKKNPHQHPLLYLKGVKYEDILSVLNFMYHGEVNVAQEQLNSFLAVAEDLQVKGLTQTGLKQQQTSQSIPASKRSTPEQSPPINKSMPMNARPPKQPRVRTSYEHAMASAPLPREMEDFTPVVKTEAPVVDVDCDPEPFPDQQLVQQNSDYQAEQGYEYQQSYQEQDIGYAGHGAVGDTNQDLDLSWDQTQMQFPCEFCEKTFRSKNSYYNHVNKHKGKTSCTICNKTLSTMSYLKAHMAQIHQM